MSVSKNRTETNRTSDTTTLFIRWQHWNWIVPELVNIVLMLLTLWILFSLIRYGNKSKKWISSRERNFEKLNAGLVLMAAVTCAVTALFRLINSQVVINIGYAYNENRQCEIVSDVSVAMFALSTLSVYIYLWIRQSVFYRNEMLKTDFSKGLKFFSYLSIFLILFGGVGLLIINTMHTNYFSTPTGCIYKSTGSNLDLTIVIVGSLVSLLGQGTLVGLYVYPLLLHNKQNNSNKGLVCGCFGKIRNEVDQESQVSHQEARQIRRAKKINSIMYRTVVFSVIIVVTNISFLFLTTYVFTGNVNRRLPTMIYDLATFLNLAFVVSSFVGWKTMTFPPIPNTPSFTFRFSRTNLQTVSQASKRG